MAGDIARWVPASLTSCDVGSLSANQNVQGYVGGDGSAGFYFTALGLYHLCYKWNFKEQEISGYASPSPFLRFSDIQLAVMRLNGTAYPHGTGLNCASNVTIPGTGFELLGAATPLVTCEFAMIARDSSRSFNTSGPVLSRNDNTIVCETPRFTELGSMYLSVKFDGVRTASVRTFQIFNTTQTYIDSSLSFPGGGPYQLPQAIQLRGVFENHGTPMCRFGSTEGTVIYHSSSYVVCQKLAFPDSARDLVGKYDLEYAPNGQCYPGPDGIASNPLSVGSFYTYNAVFESISITGAPTTAVVTTELKGSGFVLLVGGVCKFSSGGAAVETTLS
eukprot:6866369-Prymnesium_polylepis.1